VSESRRPGFTLIEVIVALVLLSVGTLAVVASGLSAARLITSAHHDEFVANAAATLADSLAASGSVGTGESVSGTIRRTWSVSLSPDSLIRTVQVAVVMEGARDSVVMTSARVMR